MGWWWTGRKAVPDARPFVPAWLTTESAEVGFARSYSEQFCEVFQRNPVGQRSVLLVSGMLGALTIDAIEGDERAARRAKAERAQANRTARKSASSCRPCSTRVLQSRSSRKQWPAPGLSATS